MSSVLMGSDFAFAHAHLHQSEPAKDQVLSQKPSKVVLHFTEALEVPLCKIEVKDERQGKVVSLKEVKADPVDPKSIEVSLNEGEWKDADYKVTWKVVSKDGHKMLGDYRFSFRANAQKK